MLPAVQTAIDFEASVRNDTPKSTRDGVAAVKYGNTKCKIVTRIESRHVGNYSRIEARFEYSNQKADGNELGLGLDESVA